MTLQDLYQLIEDYDEVRFFTEGKENFEVVNCDELAGVLNELQDLADFPEQPYELIEKVNDRYTHDTMYFQGIYNGILLFHNEDYKTFQANLKDVIAMFPLEKHRI